MARVLSGGAWFRRGSASSGNLSRSGSVVIRRLIMATTLLQLLLDFKYLTLRQLQGFDRYKYKSVDTSPLSKYVMHPFWDMVVKLFPLWVPANLLTLSGWGMMVLVFLMLCYYDPDLWLASDALVGDKVVSRWFWLFAAVSQFSAHTLDGIDGKQARRTGSSSPLGELMDHGLDSSAAWIMGISVLSLFGLGEQTAYHWEIYAIIITVLFAFYIAHWEKYNTSVMFLPWAYDISQLWLAGAYLVTFLYGFAIWKVPIPGFGGMTLCPVFKRVLYFLVVVVITPVSLLNQYRARRDTPECCPSLLEGAVPLVSLFTVTALHTLWAYLSHGQLMQTHIRLFLIAYGLLYSNINCRLIVAQMSGSICDRFNVLAYPLPFILASSYFRLIDDATMLYGYVAFLLVGHLHYGVCVVRQLCDYLNIYCFSVHKRPARHVADASNGKACRNGPVTRNGLVEKNGFVLNGKAA